MSRVAVIGAGYVGLTTAACLADLGNDVIVVDTNREKVAQLLRNHVPFYEPGLSELVERNTKAKRLTFTTSYQEAVPGAEYAIIAVSTPEGEGGEADLSFVESAAGSIAASMDGPLVVVNKSTVPPLTGDMVSRVIGQRNAKHKADVVSNPEFLREGSAIQDFMHPDRVVIGGHDRAAAVGIGYGGSCLVGEETVLVRRGDHVSLAPLAQVFAEFQPSEDADVLAWRPDTGSVFLPVTAATMRPFEGEILEVRTKMGRRVLCTPDHPFSTRHGVKLAAQLTTEDWLPLALELRTAGEPVAQFNLLDGLAAAELERSDVIVRPAFSVLEGRRARELQSVLATARSHDVLRAGALRLPELERLGLDVEGATFKTARNGTEVPVRLDASPSFWRIVGLYLAEGHVTKDGRRVRIQWSFNHHGEEDLVEEVRGFWAAHGVKVDVRHLPTTTAVVVSSRILAGFWLGVLKLGRTCNDARLPDQIWTQPAENKRALLAGYWRGDGSWSYIRGGPSVILECGTTSRDLADGLLRLLGDLDVLGSVRVGRTAKSTRDTYWIRISGADQVERLVDLVPQNERQAIIYSISQQKKRIAPTGYKRDGANTAWVRVVSVDRRPFAGAVYSLEVPGAHTFVTTGGLVTHNCFPKDVKALAALAERFDYHPELLNAVMDINRDQRMLVIDKLRDCLEELDEKVVGLLGLAFKPNTDDLREAPSLDIARVLLAAGAHVRAYDPAAMEGARVKLPAVEYTKDAYGLAAGADALVVVTEWNEFRHLDMGRLKASMRRPVIVDGRNIYDPMVMRGHGFTYRGIGRD